MIKIVDYGLGNVQAFENVYKLNNIPVSLARTAAEFDEVSHLVLPGVGSFDQAMSELERSGMRPMLEELVLEKKVPILGVCVGMQIMAERSDEGKLPGLGWIPGVVRSFQTFKQPDLLLPHMGWNNVKPVTSKRIFSGLTDDARFYFLHSFYFECVNMAHVAATSKYGKEFSCAVSSGNIHGVQFHPEKSHHYGAQLLKNFSEV